LSSGNEILQLLIEARLHAALPRKQLFLLAYTRLDKGNSGSVDSFFHLRYIALLQS
jgi:hypothetical protein